MAASYADDVRRVHRAMDAEEAGVRKPTQAERVATARAARFDRSDLSRFKEYDNMTERRKTAKSKGASAERRVGMNHVFMRPVGLTAIYAPIGSSGNKVLAFVLL